mmetsp:Transcript_8243/g.32501  ORF Transcript_8243/g.32501 Transcript_8243/m.32501 type:complete len:387 (+) Transcript_8243:215-1375(+)
MAARTASGAPWRWRNSQMAALSEVVSSDGAGSPDPSAASRSSFIPCSCPMADSSTEARLPSTSAPSLTTSTESQLARRPLTTPEAAPAPTARRMFSSRRERLPTARRAIRKRCGSAWKSDSTAATVTRQRLPMATCSLSPVYATLLSRQSPSSSSRGRRRWASMILAMDTMPPSSTKRSTMAMLRAGAPALAVGGTMGATAGVTVTGMPLGPTGEPRSPAAMSPSAWASMSAARGGAMIGAFSQATLARTWKHALARRGSGRFFRTACGPWKRGGVSFCVSVPGSGHCRGEPQRVVMRRGKRRRPYVSGSVTPASEIRRVRASSKLMGRHISASTSRRRGQYGCEADTSTASSTAPDSATAATLAGWLVRRASVPRATAARPGSCE